MNQIEVDMLYRLIESLRSEQIELENRIKHLEIDREFLYPQWPHDNMFGEQNDGENNDRARKFSLQLPDDDA
jgi:hypothetical protein